jgi:outer membrane lipoprotein SlyB
MKKFLAGLVILFVMMVSMPIAADAQCRRNCRSSVNNRNNRNVNRNNRNRNYRRPSFYQRNRNLINIAAGTGAGALIGGVLGGKKGVLIGSLIGAGASTLYTYKIKPKKKRNYRR